MNETKLSSDEVPQKFVEWLLAMGCPPETVPPVDKVADMCRGQYYMVWRSIMGRVEPKHVIRNKRLQVFCDDVRKCSKKSSFHEKDTTVVPEELSLWSHQMQLKEKVADAKARVNREKDNLQQLMDKASSKLSQRQLSHKRFQDAQRRSWLLQQVAEELREKQANLMVTKDITESLCGLDDVADIENKLEKCVTALSRHIKPSGASLVSIANPVACSSIASTNSDNCDEEVISSVVKCRSDVLFKQLYERRAALCAAIPASQGDATVDDAYRITPQSVLTNTAALQCNLALEAVKSRVHIKHTGNRFAAAVSELSNHLTSEACELVVVQCERACSEARVATLKSLCEEITSRGGIFSTGADQTNDVGAAVHVHTVGKAIECKRDELKRLISLVAAVESKTQNAKECLLSLFNGFHEGRPDSDRFGGRPCLPQESISTLRQFYEEKRERYKNQINLSMEFASENCSFSEHTGNGVPTFVDELKLYLKNFSLDSNRKLVLESGEKIWIFETLQSSLHQLYSQWQTEDLTTSLLCPSLTLKQNVCLLTREYSKKLELQEMVRALDSMKKSSLNIDLTKITEDEQKVVDKIKKRLNESIISLQKTDKILGICMENLQLWSENNMKKYISDRRTVDGQSYSAYEAAYLYSLRL